MSHTQIAYTTQEVLCDNQPGVYCRHTKENPQVDTETVATTEAEPAPPSSGEVVDEMVAGAGAGLLFSLALLCTFFGGFFLVRHLRRQHLTKR